MRNALLSAIFAVGIDPQELLKAVGLLGLFGVGFAESGIMIGFFLPGDSLLFAAGLFTYRGDLASGNIWLVSIGCAIAAVAGDQVGYMFGKRVGPALFRRKQSRFFKTEYVDAAERFFDRHGAKAIVLARFVPIVRTFCPIVAGVSRMHYRTFVRFNVIGGVLWAVGFTQLGYWLGRAFPGIGDNLELAIVVIVAFSVVPIGIEVWRHRRKAKAAAVAEAETDGAAADVAVTDADLP
jgi:membrane-associated protein